MAPAIKPSTLRPVAILLALSNLGGCFQPQRSAARRESLLREMQRGVATQAARRSERGRNSRSLGVEAAIALALERHPEVQRAKSDEAVAAAGIERASQLRNPELRVRNIEISRVANEGLELELALRLPVPQPWLLHARVQRQKSALAAAKARRLAVQRRVRLQVRQLFARLAHLQELDTAVERLAEQSRGLRRRAKEALARKTLTAADALLPELRHHDARALRARIAKERRIIINALSRAVGDTGKAAFRSRTSDLRRYGSTPRTVTLERRASRTIAHRPTQKLAAARLDVARADRYIAKASRWPWLRFAEVSYLIQPETDKQRLQLYVGLTIPLFSLNGGGVALSEARVEQRRREQRLALREALRQRSLAAARVKAAKKHLASSRAARRRLNKAHELLEATSKQGPRGLLRATSLAWRLYQAQRQHLDAELDLRLAQLALEERAPRP